ncbi:hypothetical protein BDD43_4866 [Mucilaginibacter gracilis]|uniref:Uncharacterized protein n=1 Tax=Mucilaginibacter gracilis TaxID=423350 RepID=A0A495J6K6_9SPHI|nr:hypothetical protein [Mucilaginibacter gracilis]RKR84620.1 hypothetical protein BDD43_4866 [Mucilaginibacter gracilis]
MKNITAKKFNKRINKLHRFNDLIDDYSAETTVGDPTNTTITVLTTVSGPPIRQAVKGQSAQKPLMD